MLEWKPSTDLEGDAIEYCVTVNEDSEPDDVPVFTACDDEIFTSDTSYTLAIPLEPGKKYWRAVWAKDTANWSGASELSSFEGRSTEPSQILCKTPWPQGPESCVKGRSLPGSHWRHPCRLH